MHPIDPPRSLLALPALASPALSSPALSSPALARRRSCAFAFVTLAVLVASAAPCAASGGALHVIRSDSRGLEVEWSPGRAQSHVARLFRVPPGSTPTVTVTAVRARPAGQGSAATGDDGRPASHEWATIDGTFSMRGERIARLVLHSSRDDVARGELLRAVSLRARVDYGTTASLSRSGTVTAPAQGPWIRALDSTLLNPEVASDAWVAGRNRAGRGRALRGGGSSFESSANWMRVLLTEAGIYRLDSFAFANAGLDPGGIDPASIRVFAGTILQLEESYAMPPPEFMQECAILDLTNDDAVFGKEDSFLFHALSPHGWAQAYHPSRSPNEHVENQYTDESAYWITWNGIGETDSFPGPPRRMGTRSITPLGPPYATSAPHRVHFEENVVENFRYRSEDGWFWENLQGQGKDRTYMLELERVASGDGKLTARLASFGEVFEPLLRGVELKIGDEVVAQASWTHGLNTAIVDVVSDGLQGLFQDGPNAIRVNVDPGIPENGDRLYTAWFDVEYNRELSAVDGFLHFRAAAGSADFELSGFESDEIHVFDVSDPREVVHLVDSELTGTSPRSVRFSDGAAEDRRYSAITPAGARSLPAPEIVEHAGLRRPENAATYLVLHHPSLQDGAERLAEIRRIHGGGGVAGGASAAGGGGAAGRVPGGDSAMAVSLARIFDEFSWGMEDPVAIRDFLAWACANWAAPPLYVALLGDAVYDTKGFGAGSADNLLSSYGNRYRTDSLFEYVTGLNLNSFSTDDFFGYLEAADHDGVSEPALDLAIGRFPAETPAELDIALDKLESYLGGEEPGPWENRAILVADDERTLSESAREPYHTQQTERIATEALPRALDKAKVYLTEFPFDAFGHKPEARAALLEEISRGALLVSFTGHGDRNTLAQEEVLVADDVRKLANGRRTPVFSAFSSTVSQFDFPFAKSMAELLLFQPDGGAVATFASGGLVFPSQSFLLHQGWLGEIFDDPVPPGRSGRVRSPLGLAAMIAKATLGSTRSMRQNNEKYVLLGDPGLVLRYPALPAGFEPATVDVPVAHRSRRRVEGRITDGEGRILDGTNGTLPFHGTAFVRVTANADTSGYDYELGGAPQHIDYSLEGALLFEGEVAVEDGRFEVRFLIPGATEPGTSGRIRVYAIEEGGSRIASGAYDELNVAPTISSAEAPELR